MSFSFVMMDILGVLHDLIQFSPLIKLSWPLSSICRKFSLLFILNSSAAFPVSFAIGWGSVHFPRSQLLPQPWPFPSSDTGCHSQPCPLLHTGLSGTAGRDRPLPQGAAAPRGLQISEPTAVLRLYEVAKLPKHASSSLAEPLPRIHLTSVRSVFRDPQIPQDAF